MSYHISDETKRRLALGLAPQIGKNRNRLRKSSVPLPRGIIALLLLWWAGLGVVFFLMFLKTL